MNILITGGAGFIGSNVADFFAKKGENVVVLDNLSRKNVEKNLAWLESNHKNIEFEKADIRFDQEKLEELSEESDVVFHFASQVAVTTSVSSPLQKKIIRAACRQIF